MGTATIYVMPLGGTNVKPVLDAFKEHERYIRGELARTVNLRHAPQVRFREDVSFEEATRIDRLLDSPKVRQDTAKPVEPKD
jgi:ribosome-binding factor A